MTKKSGINWPFRRKSSGGVNRRTSSSSPNLTDTSSDSVTNIFNALKSPLLSRKKLNQKPFFGRKLESICTKDGNLPTPVVNMLKQLYMEGPFTVGIFRKSANARICREIEAKLEVDPSFPLTDVNIVVVGSVFKEFLRRLPNCLLDSRMYNKWIEAVSEENSDEEIRTKVLQLLKRLPPLNILLLRHLLCLLHLISRHSAENKMCSMNLAVCIGPSILSSNCKISVDKREEVSKSVPRVISYLIDNWPTLFDPITTSDIMSSCPTRASTSSLNLDSATPASQSSYEGTPSGSSSLTSTPSPISTVITPTPLPSPVSPPSYQETMAKMAHHYHQQQQLLLQQQSQGLQSLPLQPPVTIQPIVQRKVPQQVFHQVQQVVPSQQLQQSQPVVHALNNNHSNNNNNNVTTPKKVIQSTSSSSSSASEGEEGTSEAVQEIKSNLLNNTSADVCCSSSSNSMTSNGCDESGKSSSNSCYSSIKSNTLGRDASSKLVCVEQRCAKDLTEDWRKDIHCSVAYLRTLFNGSSPDKSCTSDVTTPIKSSGLSSSYRDLNNRSSQLYKGEKIDNQNNNNNHNNSRKCLSTSRLMGERIVGNGRGIMPAKSIITLVPIGTNTNTSQSTPTSSFGTAQHHRRFIKNSNSNSNHNHTFSNSNLMSNNGNSNDKNCLSSCNNLRLDGKSNLMFRSSIDLASYKNSCSNNNTFNQNNHRQQLQHHHSQQHSHNRHSHNHLVTNSNKNINNIINLFNSYNDGTYGSSNSNSSSSYHRLSHPQTHKQQQACNNGHNSFQGNGNSYNNNYLNNFNNNCYFNPKSNSSRSGSISIYVSQNAINGKPGIVSIHNRTDSLSSFSGAEESYV